MKTELDTLKATGGAPEWATDEALKTLSRGYLLEGETPRDMYLRLAGAAAERLNRPDLKSRFFDLMWNNWLCPASPVCSNFGTNRGMVISCFGSSIPDSVDGIFQSMHETAMLSKHGGGLGHYWGDVRGRGAVIGNENGHSEGIVPWLKVEDAVISSVAQGGVRRGSSASYLPANHLDIDEFLDIRRQTGDDSRRCRSTGFHHAVIYDDDFMQGVVGGGKREREVWSKSLKTRWETGEPYMMFDGNVNRANPPTYAANGLTVKSSQLCSEITLFSDDDHTFVCCLSSMNLARYDEWKDTDAVQLSIWFLDAVMEDFIQKSEGLPGFEKARRFAIKSRALGLGALGWHTYLQSKMIPFESFQAMMLNAEIFRHIDTESKVATEKLAAEYGEPEWCQGFNVRNTHRLAVAPTLSNSIISGGMSEGIQPVVANVYANKTAKGTFLRRNPALEVLLESKGKNVQSVWSQINADRGSVRNLDFLNPDEKSVFLTAREINQFSIVRQAAQRQKFIDQAQSLNLFFATPEGLNADERKAVGQYVHQVHLEAWETGVKTLYYLRTESALRGESAFRTASDCLSCEG